jgi:hypothetical protein
MTLFYLIIKTFLSYNLNYYAAGSSVATKEAEQLALLMIEH